MQLKLRYLAPVVVFVFLGNINTGLLTGQYVYYLEGVRKLFFAKLQFALYDHTGKLITVKFPNYHNSPYIIYEQAELKILLLIFW